VTTIGKPADGDTSWGPEVRAVIGAVNAAHTIYSTEPPPGSLSPIAADGTTNDRANIQAHLDAVGAAGGGRVVLSKPGGAIKLNSGITLPPRVQLVWPQSTTLDFSGIGGAAAITVDDSDFCPIVGGPMIGPNTGDGSSFSSTASTGVSVTGHGLTFENLNIQRFARGVDVDHEGTFILNFVNCGFGNNGCCVFGDFAGAFGGTARSSAGERIGFSNCTFYNSVNILTASAAGATFFFDNRCSFDYSMEFFKIADAHVFYSNCHMETTSGTGDSWATHTDFLGGMSGTARLYMSNVSIIMGGSVLKIIDSSAGPSNYGSGFALFTNCVAYCGGSQTTSRALVSAGIPGATSKTFTSPFLTKWNTVRAYQVTTDGYAARAPVSPYVSSCDTSTTSLTVTFSALVDDPTWIEVAF
jgi:hypothetical protein